MNEPGKVTPDGLGTGTIHCQAELDAGIGMFMRKINAFMDSVLSMLY